MEEEYRRRDKERIIYYLKPILSLLVKSSKQDSYNYEKG